jgi:hypothetical protein
MSVSPFLSPPRAVGVVRAWPAPRVAVLVGAVGALALLVLDALVRDAPAPQGDDLIYERMAQDPLAPHTFPFAYRIAIPYLVHVLPAGHDLSFSVLAWLCSGAAGAFLYLAMERLGVARRLSVVLALLFVLSPTLLVESLRQGRNPDAFTALVMCAGLWCVVARARAALLVTVLVGALNRESALFLLPFAYAVWTDRLWNPRLLRDVVLLGLPAIGAMVALRLAIPTAGNGYGSVDDRWALLRQGLDGWDVNARRIGSVAGPMWVMAALALRESEFARRSLVLVALCVASFPFAGDWSRVLFVAAPVVFAAGAIALQPRRRWWVPVVLLLVLMDVGYAVYMDRIGVRTGIIEAPTGGHYPIQ